MKAEPTTELVIRLAEGDNQAAAKLMPLIYDELRELAARYMRRERHDHTLQPTALANEVYLRLAQTERVSWQGKAQFLALAACQIRKILVDHARKRNALKRGDSSRRRPLEAISDVATISDDDMLALDDALNRLTGRAPRQAQVVELRFFAGMTVEEVAEVMDVSTGTVKGDWRVARAWLAQEIIE